VGPLLYHPLLLLLVPCPMKNKWLFDLLPVILFFVAFRLADHYIATAVAIATSAAPRQPVSAMRGVSTLLPLMSASICSPFSRPGPRKDRSEVRFALSKGCAITINLQA